MPGYHFDDTEVEVVDLRSFTEDDFKVLEKENTTWVVERALELPVRALQNADRHVVQNVYGLPEVAVKAPPITPAAPHNPFTEHVMETKAVRRKVETVPSRQTKLPPLRTYTGQDEERVRLLMDFQGLDGGPSGEIINFDKCWPYPFKSPEPDNPNLVFFAVNDGCGQDNCDLCNASTTVRIELYHATHMGFIQTPKLSKTGFGDRKDLLAELKNEVHAKMLEAAQVANNDPNGRAKPLPEVDARNTVMKHFLLPKDYAHIKTLCKPRTPEFDTRTEVLVAQFEKIESYYYAPPKQKVFDLQMRCMRVFMYQSKFFFYLDLTSAKMKECLYEFDDVSFKMLRKWYMEGKLNSNFIKVPRPSSTPEKLPFTPKDVKAENSGVFEGGYDLMEVHGLLEDMRATESERQLAYADTSDFAEAPQPAGFSLTLRDYQRRSLSWMKAVEANETSDGYVTHNLHSKSEGAPVKIKLGETGWYIDLFNKEITQNPATTQIEPLRIKGGILADDTGTGKTITCLALIHSTPLTTEMAKERFKSCTFGVPFRVPSQATCVVCPSNLYSQWISEAKRCNPNFRIAGLSCIRDYQKYSWKDLMLADLVVISYQFLTNTNYHLQLKALERNTLHHVQDELDEKGRFQLSKIHFYRLIFDEIHEMSYKNAKCIEMAKSLKADLHWGITGTPKFESGEDFTALFPYLNISESNNDVILTNKMAQEEFLAKFVKRNVPNLQLPPMIHETVWVHATAEELALMTAMNHNRTIEQRIMACSHYQIAEDASAGQPGDSFLTISEVKTRLEGERLAKMKAKEAAKESALKTLEAHRAKPGPITDLNKYQRDLDRYKENVKRTEAEYNRAQGEYNFFVNVCKSLDQPAQNECLICRDTIRPESLAMLPCSHLYCSECLEAALANRMACPFCLHVIDSRSKVMKIRPPVQEPVRALNAKGLDTTKYGSKLIELYNYLTKLIETDPNARVILFLQYGSLSKYISTTLDELKIKHVRVNGNVFKRQDAIKQFTTSSDVRIVMLSSEDSVSGINLTQATHIILLHPFYTGKGLADDLAFEKQGICRAYRSGLDHPLKVVRFAVRSTVEEELTLEREGKF